MTNPVDTLNAATAEAPVWAVCVLGRNFEHAEHIYYTVADFGLSPVLIRFEKGHVEAVDQPRPGRLALGYLVGLVLGLVAGVLFPWLVR